MPRRDLDIRSAYTAEQKAELKRRADALHLSLSRYVALVALGRIPAGDPIPDGPDGRVDGAYQRRRSSEDETA